jgi:hypothetical protein
MEVTDFRVEGKSLSMKLRIQRAMHGPVMPPHIETTHDRPVRFLSPQRRLFAAIGLYTMPQQQLP